MHLGFLSFPNRMFIVVALFIALLLAQLVASSYPSYPVSGSLPAYVAIDTSGNVWTANYDSSTVSKLSSTGTFLDSYTGPTNPNGITADSSGNIWVTGGPSTVMQFTSSGSNTFTVCTGPWGITYANSQIWVACGSSNSIGVINSVGIVTTYSPQNLNNPAGIGVQPTSGNVWLSNFDGASVTVLTSSGDYIISHSVGSEPVYVAVDFDENVWVSCQGSDVVYKFTYINSTATTTTFFISGNGPHAIVFDGINTAFIANTNDGTVVQMSQKGTIMNTFQVPSAQGLAFDSSGDLWVTDTASDSVYVISKVGTPSTSPTRSPTTQAQGVDLDLEISLPIISFFLLLMIFCLCKFNVCTPICFKGCVKGTANRFGDCIIRLCVACYRAITCRDAVEKQQQAKEAKKQKEIQVFQDIESVVAQQGEIKDESGLINAHASISLDGIYWLEVEAMDSSVNEKNKHLKEKPNPKDCCAVSWRWVDNKVLDQTVQDIVDELLNSGYRYAWIDRCCVPQERFDVDSVLQASAVYDTGKVVLMSLSPKFDKEFSYGSGRLWTTIEVYRSLCRNEISIGIGSLCPEDIEMRKVKLLFKFLVKVFEKGGGNTRDLRQGKLTFEHISTLLREEENDTKPTKIATEINGKYRPILMFDFKPYKAILHLGIVQFLLHGELACAKKSDTNVVAGSLLTNAALASASKKLLGDNQNSPFPLIALVLDTGDAIEKDQTRIFIEEASKKTAFKIFSFTSLDTLILQLEGGYFEFHIPSSKIRSTKRQGSEFQEKIDARCLNEGEVGLFSAFRGVLLKTSSKSTYFLSNPLEVLYVPPDCDLDYTSLGLRIVKEWTVKSVPAMKKRWPKSLDGHLLRYLHFIETGDSNSLMRTAPEEFDGETILNAIDLITERFPICEDVSASFKSQKQYNLFQSSKDLQVKKKKDAVPATQLAIAKELFAQNQFPAEPLPLELFDLPWNPDLAEYKEDLMHSFPSIKGNDKQLPFVSSLFIKIVALFETYVLVMTKRGSLIRLFEDMTFQLDPSQKEPSGSNFHTDLHPKILLSSFKVTPLLRAIRLKASKETIYSFFPSSDPSEVLFTAPDCGLDYSNLGLTLTKSWVENCTPMIRKRWPALIDDHLLYFLHFIETGGDDALLKTLPESLGGDTINATIDLITNRFPICTEPKGAFKSQEYEIFRVANQLKVKKRSDAVAATQKAIAKELFLQTTLCSKSLPLELFKLPWNPDLAEHKEDLMILYPDFTINLKQSDVMKSIFVKVVGSLKNHIIILSKRQNYFELFEDMTIQYHKEPVPINEEAGAKDIHLVLSGDYVYSANIRSELFKGPGWNLLITR